MALDPINNYIPINVGGTPGTANTGVYKTARLSDVLALAKDGRLLTASSVAPTVRSDGTPLVAGDLWYDIANSTLKARVGAAWVVVVPAGAATLDPRIQASTTAPATRTNSTPLSDGDLWYDMTANALKVRDTSAWVAVGGAASASADARMQAGAAAPTTRADASALQDGDIWYDTTANLLKVRESGAWVPAGGGDVVGPASATDNAVARFDATTGKLIQGSGVIIDDANNVSGVVNLTTTGNTVLGDAAADTLTFNASTLAVPNNLNIANNTLFVETANKWVGFGTNTPQAAIEVVGSVAHASVPVALGEMDLALSGRFTKTVTGATTFSFANVPAGSRATEVVLQLTNGGTQALTWPASVTWLSGSAPTLKTAGTDLITFRTFDGGSTWVAEAAAQSGAATPDARFQTSGVAPTLRADGDPLDDGDTWYDTANNELMIRDAGVWVLASRAVASIAQAQAWTDNTVDLTPGRLADAFQGSNQSLALSGYQKLPGGLIIQWASGFFNANAGGWVPFAMTFPTGAMGIASGHNQISGLGNIAFASASSSAVYVVNQYGGSIQYFIIAVGF